MNLRHPYFENLCILRYCDGTTALRILFLPFVYNSTSPQEMLRTRFDTEPFSCRILRTLPPSLTMMYICRWLTGDCESDDCDYEDYNQALLWACRSGSLDELQYLLSSTEEAKENPWLLVAAAEKGQLHVVNFLTSGRGYYVHKFIAIDIACQNGHLEIVKAFIQQGNTASTYFLGSSCLNGGHLEVSKYLISCGADARAISDYVVYLLCREGSWEILEYLVSQGTSICMLDAILLGRKAGWIRALRLFTVDKSFRLPCDLVRAATSGIFVLCIAGSFLKYSKHLT